MISRAASRSRSSKGKVRRTYRDESTQSTTGRFCGGRDFGLSQHASREAVRGKGLGNGVNGQRCNSRPAGVATLSFSEQLREAFSPGWPPKSLGTQHVWKPQTHARRTGQGPREGENLHNPGPTLLLSSTAVSPRRGERKQRACPAPKAGPQQRLAGKLTGRPEFRPTGRNWSCRTSGGRTIKGRKGGERETRASEAHLGLEPFTDFLK